MGGAGALLAWNIYARAQAAYSLNFLPGRIKSLSFNGVRPVLTVEMQVQNTSNHVFNVLSIAGNVYVNSGGKDYLIGDVEDFQPVQIAANSVKVLDIDLVLQITGVVSDMIQTVSSGVTPQTVKLAAFANVDQLQVPLNYQYKLAI